MKTFKFLCLSALMLICTLGAKAQTTFTGNLNQYVLPNYRSTSITFSLTEICKALDVDTAQFVMDYNDWLENGGTNLVTLETDEHSTSYTQGSNGCYWMSAEGKSVEWATDDCIWCTYMWPDAETDKFEIAICQMPDKAQVGDIYHATIALTYNDNQVLFDLTDNIVEKPDLGIETSLSKLNILGTCEASVTEEPRTNYNADRVTMDISAALKALNYDDVSVVANNLSDYLYMAWYDSNTESKEDVLRNTWTANSGFWTGTFYDETTGDETGELVENVDWKVYVEQFKLDVDAQTLSFNCGQQPSALKNSLHYNLPMYLINGNNAYILKLNFNTTDPDPEDVEIDFKEKTKIGEQDVLINEYPTTGYETFATAIDNDSILALLGITQSQAKFYCENSEEFGDVTNVGNAGSSTSFWLDEDGYIKTWGTGSYVTISYDQTQLSSCQMPGVYAVGDTTTIRCYLAGPQTYYQFNVTIAIKAKEGIKLDEYEMVADEMIEAQLIPTADYSDGRSGGSTIYLNDLVEQLGAGSYTFLAEELADDGVSVLISDSYNCDPHPAFWMGEGYVRNWGNNNSFAIFYNVPSVETAGSFSFIQLPSVRSVGDSYKANFYLANAETKKYVHYTLYLEYVDEVHNWVNVGNETVILPESGSEGDYAETPIDLTKCMEALGCDYEVFQETGSWQIMNQDGKFTTEGYEDEMYGFWFDKDGNPTTDPDAQAYSIEFLPSTSSDCGQACFRTYAFEAGTYSLIMAAINGDNRYIFHITLCEDPTAIKNITTNASTSKSGVYDLSGRKITNPAKGMYISNGKKYIVK